MTPTDSQRWQQPPSFSCSSPSFGAFGSLSTLGSFGCLTPQSAIPSLGGGVGGGSHPSSSSQQRYKMLMSSNSSIPLRFRSPDIGGVGGEDEWSFASQFNTNFWSPMNANNYSQSDKSKVYSNNNNNNNNHHHQHQEERIYSHVKVEKENFVIPLSIELDEEPLQETSPRLQDTSPLLPAEDDFRAEQSEDDKSCHESIVSSHSSDSEEYEVIPPDDINNKNMIN